VTNSKLMAEVPDGPAPMEVISHILASMERLIGKIEMRGG